MISLPTHEMPTATALLGTANARFITVRKAAVVCVFVEECGRGQPRCLMGYGSKGNR